MFLLVGASLCFVSCAEPPDKEIQQAQGAIEAAKAVGAEQYARDEFAAAETALKNANDAVAQRDYRLALNHALDARDRAKTAAREAADRKAVSRVDADHAIADAARALAGLQARLKAAPGGSRTVADARRGLAVAERDLQKARTSFDAGSFLDAVTSAKGASIQLQLVAKALDGATTAGARRRH